MTYESLLANERPKVPIRLLKREGVLSAVGNKVVITSDWLSVLVMSISPTNALFFWKDHDRDRDQLVTLTSVPRRFGAQVAFQCPISGKPCFELYYSRRGFASAGGLGILQASQRGSRIARGQAKLDGTTARLLGLEGFGRARGQNRERLIAKALEVPLATRIVPGLDTIAHEQEQRARRRAQAPHRSKRKTSAYSTEAALARGATEAPSTGRNTPQQLIAYIRTRAFQDSDPEAVRSRPPKLLEQVAALDARELSRQWTGKPSWQGVLMWPPEVMEGAEKFVIVADLSDPETASVGLRGFGSDGQARLHLLNVAPAGPNKPTSWVFICPILGSRHDVLFLRDGLFASARAQRLVHASQRSASMR